MIVDSKGRGWVGDFGFSIFEKEQPKPGNIILIDHSGENKAISVNCETMMPNGISLSKDENVLIVAETVGGKLTAFDINDENGKLSNKRDWTNFDPDIIKKRYPSIKARIYPDGISQVDSGDGIWTSGIYGPVTRCLANDSITH